MVRGGWIFDLINNFKTNLKLRTKKVKKNIIWNFINTIKEGIKYLKLTKTKNFDKRASIAPLQCLLSNPINLKKQ